MSPTGSASGDSVPASVQEQVANVLEELQILGNLEKLVSASEVSGLIPTLTSMAYVRLRTGTGYGERGRESGAQLPEYTKSGDSTSNLITAHLHRDSDGERGFFGRTQTRFPAQRNRNVHQEFAGLVTSSQKHQRRARATDLYEKSSSMITTSTPNRLTITFALLFFGA